MGKDLSSRKLKVGITKEGNFLAWKRPLIGFGKDSNLESILIES
jgi:hypothetical protein